EPSAGTVYLDGTNIADLTLANLRAQFALVSQDVFLFDDTLLANVRYSRPEASEEEVLAALKAANLQDLVENSPHGLHQPIGANGNQLSGGLRQRVSIARAILKDAPILLLDEATSALDNESERLVQQALERLMHGRTSIIVAHRLSTIEQADRIIVMDDGKIIEEGNHNELLAKQGYYAALNHMPKQD
uniref:ABC transporter ATP-binding protein n=1 Tax=Neisseria weixii TaxID=1853276 RepID=UPI0035A04252